MKAVRSFVSYDQVRGDIFFASVIALPVGNGAILDGLKIRIDDADRWGGLRESQIQSREWNHKKNQYSKTSETHLHSLKNGHAASGGWDEELFLKM